MITLPQFSFDVLLVAAALAGGIAGLTLAWWLAARTIGAALARLSFSMHHVHHVRGEVRHRHVEPPIPGDEWKIDPQG